MKAQWSGTQTVGLHFPMKPRLYRGFNDAVAIERGPLVFALPIEAEWKKVKDNPQFADWEVYPKSPWNYALQIDREHPERVDRVRGTPRRARTRSRRRAPR